MSRIQNGHLKGLGVQQNAVKHSVLLNMCSRGPKIVFRQTTFSPSTFQCNSHYLERNLYLDMLEDSQLQVMRLGECNMRKNLDSDLQILGFRCFHGHFKGLGVQQNAVKHSVLLNMLRLCSLRPKIVFPQTTFFPSTFQFNSQYLERNLYLDMLEDSQLQIMRLGEFNMRHLEDSDLQILGFRCFTMDISRDWESNKLL